MTHYVLGIDGGGTNTHAAILDGRGNLCGSGASGPSNYDDVGVATSRANIEQAVNAARNIANLPVEPFSAAFLGMAGVASPADRDIVHGIAQDLQLAPPERVGVDHDIRIALAGGLAGRPGIVIIAGTGSSCYGRNASGDSWRAGGWGPLVSDEGSGYWLGVQAMKAAVRAFDGRAQPTVLLEGVRNWLELSHMDDLLHHLYVKGMSRVEIAAMAPLVIEAAQAGDAVASGLIGQGAQALADCVLAVAQRLGFTERPCELALAGGLFRAGDVVVQPLSEAVSDRLPLCRVTLSKLAPVLGACLLALESMDVDLDKAAIQGLRRRAEAHLE